MLLWTPGPEEIGEHEVVISVSDNKRTVLQSQVVIVKNVVDSPPSRIMLPNIEENDELLFATFTNAGATSNEGPTQAQIDAAYSGTELAGTVTVTTRGIQEWTVLEEGTYRIEVVGAGGGNGFNNGSTTIANYGGYGTRMAGDLGLSEGDVIKVLVGQKGFEETSYTHRPGGGGGGTFVTYGDNTPLIIAGGGSGGGQRGYGQGPGQDAIIAESGQYTGAPSQGGSASGNYGGAGAGLVSDGQTHSATAAKSFVNGGVGGKPTNHARMAVGGFGGGGGAQLLPGGGGGYAGGNKTGSWAVLEQLMVVVLITVVKTNQMNMGTITSMEKSEYTSFLTHLEIKSEPLMPQLPPISLYPNLLHWILIVAHLHSA